MGGGHREDSEGPTITTTKTYLRGYGGRIIGADVVTHSACDSGKEQPRCRENGNESRREDREERDRTQSNTESALYSYSTHGYKKAALRWITVASFPLLISLPEQGRREMPRPLCNAQGSQSIYGHSVVLIGLTSLPTNLIMAVEGQNRAEQEQGGLA